MNFLYRSRTWLVAAGLGLVMLLVLLQLRTPLLPEVQVLVVGAGISGATFARLHAEVAVCWSTYHDSAAVCAAAARS